MCYKKEDRDLISEAETVAKVLGSRWETIELKSTTNSKAVSRELEGGLKIMLHIEQLKE